MPTYAYPTSNELEVIEQKLLPRLTADSPFFSIMPFEGANETLLRWEQEDDYVGLQQIRGYGGAPPRVARVGIKEYIAKPGVYGEYIMLDEEELTNRRAMGSYGAPIQISDIVARAHAQLLTRRIARQEKIIADLLVNGTFSVADINGKTLISDSFTPQTFTASVPWSTVATSTPIADLRACQLIPVGQSVRVDATSEVWMNRVTANYLLSNTNANDLGGRRLYGLSPANSIEAINMILQGEDLPQIRIYEGGYKADNGTWTRFLPTGKALLVGRRTSGAKIGGYRYTRNINSPNAAPVPYVRVIDKGEENIPGVIEVHDGHNGGPVLYFPGALVTLTNLSA